MKKLFVCSDIHGDYFAFHKMIQLAQDNPLIIAGDLVPSTSSFESFFHQNNNELIMVSGNCDISYDFQLAGIYYPPQLRELDFNNRKIIITHGDIFSPEVCPIKLSKGDIFISGHTHRPKLFLNSKNIIELNPGSTSRPRGGFPPSYAVIEKHEIKILGLEDELLIYSLEY
ncbi:MAG: YfcE family phosphodiesterase [Spirochaetaceae bacterium]|nr:YfcE family phosphodiesterase [Spirochaetaceae bacterium]